MGAKNLAGKNVLRLIQIRLTTLSFEKIRSTVKTIRRKRRSLLPIPRTPSEFHPHAQRETLSVVAMRVNNPDCSPLGIYG
jgi:hypothetical protein